MSAFGDVKQDSRVAEILEWLSRSKFAVPMQNGRGFFVRRGPIVRLQDGRTGDLFDWLSDEGIVGGSGVAGYSVNYTDPQSEWGERLTFFWEGVFDAPFSSRQTEIHANTSQDDAPQIV